MQTLPSWGGISFVVQKCLLRGSTFGLVEASACVFRGIVACCAVIVISLLCLFVLFARKAAGNVGLLITAPPRPPDPRCAKPWIRGTRAFNGQLHWTDIMKILNECGKFAVLCSEVWRS